MTNLLEQQYINPSRAAACHHAAQTIIQLNVSVIEIVANKIFDGLIELPDIDEGIGRTIYEYLIIKTHGLKLIRAYYVVVNRNVKLTMNERTMQFSKTCWLSLLFLFNR